MPRARAEPRGPSARQDGAVQGAGNRVALREPVPGREECRVELQPTPEIRRLNRPPESDRSRRLRRGSPPAQMRLSGSSGELVYLLVHIVGSLYDLGIRLISPPLHNPVDELLPHRY